MATDAVMTRTDLRNTDVGRNTGIGKPSRSALRTWPLDRSAAATLFVTYLAIGVVLAGLGLLIVKVLDDSALQRFDVRVARWFAAQRTPTRNDIGQIGAGLADAYTLTPAVVLASIFFVIKWRRWHDVIMLGGALVMEKALFLPVTLLVDRDRPPVEQLDGAPPTSSYPSGHVAAAVVAYVALCIIVRWHVRNPAVRSAFVVLACAAPLTVAIARLYLGMHHVSDVVVGAASGAVCLLAVHHALTASLGRRHDLQSLPTSAQTLELTGSTGSARRHGPQAEELS